MGALLPSIIIAFITMFVPGFLLALALLRKTELSFFEITVIGFFFGIMAPGGLTWLEAYLIPYIHAFTFSLGLFEANAVLLTAIGLFLCYRNGALKELLDGSIMKRTEAEKTHGATKWVWMLLLAIMLLTFATRMFSIGIAPRFFEFDPYFDMMNAQQIIIFGQQLHYDPSAWPIAPNGTVRKIQPIVPYDEAYWYSLASVFGGNSTPGVFNTSLMSDLSSFYPPIVGALLVFAIFMLIYHEYDAKLGLIAAGLTATMAVLFTTFIAGEQLLEPWGIFTLFFFLAAYLLSVRNPKDWRLAVFAGIGFISTVLGAHYYTVTAGILAVYIVGQGLIDILRNDVTKDFYKQNAILLVVVGIFLLAYQPYGATLTNRIPTVLGIPLIWLLPAGSLAFVWVIDYIIKFAGKQKIINSAELLHRFAIIALLVVIAVAVVLFTPLGKPLQGYIHLSSKFTTPSSSLFMTVQEFIPTGLGYNFGAAGFGFIGTDIGGSNFLIWVVSVAAIALLVISIVFRRSRSAILYAAIAIPMMIAGFSEVKYLPHFGAVYIMLFAIMLGELIYIVEHNYKFRITKSEVDTELRMKLESAKEAAAEEKTGILSPKLEVSHETVYVLLSIGIFFISPFLALAFLVYLLFTAKPNARNYLYGMIAIIVILEIAGYLVNGSPMLGESSSILSAFQALLVSGNPNACSIINNQQQNAVGAELYCNVVPQYWLTAAAWMRANVGPYAPRILAWWDYGDWINWFGNSNAVIRGDNAFAKEDYGTAAHFVLGPKDGFTSKSLAAYMNANQSKYVLFDDQLVAKWQALDFLACIGTNQTSYQFAQAAGGQLNPPQPYALGTSTCETTHDPQFALIPLQAILPSNQTANSNFYCPMSNETTIYAKAFLVVGETPTNQTACVSLSPNQNGVLSVYNSNGTKMNALIQSADYLGVVNIGQVPFVEYLMIYMPSANGTVENAPTEFYTSNYYDGFFLGHMDGFTQVYPENGTGVNYINGTYPIRIFAVDNYTGTLPPVPSKPSYIHNNYTMP